MTDHCLSVFLITLSLSRLTQHSFLTFALSLYIVGLILQRELWLFARGSVTLTHIMQTTSPHVLALCWISFAPDCRAWSTYASSVTPSSCFFYSSCFPLLKLYLNLNMHYICKFYINLILLLIYNTHWTNLHWNTCPPL